MLWWIAAGLLGLGAAALGISIMALEARMIAALKARDPQWIPSSSSIDRLRNVRAYAAVFPKDDPLNRRWRRFQWVMGVWAVLAAGLILPPWSR